MDFVVKNNSLIAKYSSDDGNPEFLNDITFIFKLIARTIRTRKYTKDSPRSQISSRESLTIYAFLLDVVWNVDV